MDRRNVITSAGMVAITAVAGCSAVRSLSGEDGVPDLYLQNGDTDAHRIEFEVTHAGETVLQDALALEPGKSATYDDPFTKAGSYSISISTDSGLEASHTWDEGEEPSSGDDDGLQVRIEAETITFETVVA